MDLSATDVILTLHYLFRPPSVGYSNTKVLSRLVACFRCSRGIGNRTLPERWTVIDGRIGDAGQIALVDRCERWLLVLEVESEIDQRLRRDRIEIFVFHTAGDIDWFHGRHCHVSGASHYIIGRAQQSRAEVCPSVIYALDAGRRRTNRYTSWMISSPSTMPDCACMLISVSRL